MARAIHYASQRRDRPFIAVNCAGLTAVVAYIQQHSTEIGSRKDVAEHLGISLEQVSKRIQTHTGQTFRQFLHNCRLETTKQLLQTTDLDVSQISQRTAFQTVQHFSRVFRHYAGIPPQQYRLKSRAQN